MEDSRPSFEAQFHTMKTDPSVVLSRGLGSWLWDSSGKEYIDLCAGFGSLALGHRPMNQIVSELQSFFNLPADALVHGLGDLYYNEAKLALLEKLAAIMPPGLRRFAFSLGGSGAVEIAIKAAVLRRSTDGFIALKIGYHGLDFGSLQVTGQERFREPFKGLLHSGKVGFIKLPSDNKSAAEFLDLSLKTHFNGDASRIAGLIVEPILGRGGVKPLGREVLRALRNWTSERGILLIFDEIFCGLGRAGVWSHATPDCTPDIAVYGKALGGGFPTSVCAMSDDVSKCWPDLKGEAIHTGTFFGHPFMSSLATHTLHKIESENLLARSVFLGAKALDLLITSLANFPEIQVRGSGLMIGIDLGRPGAAVSLMHRLRDQYATIAIPSGEFGEVLSITPALNIPEEVMIEAIQRIVACIRIQAGTLLS